MTTREAFAPDSPIRALYFGLLPILACPLAYWAGAVAGGIVGLIVR